MEEARKLGLSYVWVDEAAGTIRASFCDVRRFDELPFRCSLKQADSLAQLAASVAVVRADGIPRRELVEAEWSDPNEMMGLELVVYAAPLGFG